MPRYVRAYLAVPLAVAMKAPALAGAPSLLRMSARMPAPARAPFVAGAAALSTTLAAPLATFAAEQKAVLSQLPPELIADNGTATLAIVVGLFIPCAFLITIYFGTEQKKAGIAEGQRMGKD